MKVLLRADVEGLGRLGDLVTVRPGYGRNYLLPQGFAMLATPANLKVFELERKKLETKVEAQRKEASTLAEKIQNTAATISMRVGENDKLYGSVNSTLIAETLAKLGVEVDRRRILLDSPIRSIGVYNIRIRLHAGVIAELPLTVAPERLNIEEDEPQVAEANEPESKSAKTEESVE